MPPVRSAGSGVGGWVIPCYTSRDSLALVLERTRWISSSPLERTRAGTRIPAHAPTGIRGGCVRWMIRCLRTKTSCRRSARMMTSLPTSSLIGLPDPEPRRKAASAASEPPTSPGRRGAWGEATAGRVSTVVEAARTRKKRGGRGVGVRKWRRSCSVAAEQRCVLWTLELRQEGVVLLTPPSPLALWLVVPEPCTGPLEAWKQDRHYGAQGDAFGTPPGRAVCIARRDGKCTGQCVSRCCFLQLCPL